jgi:hypothetical protein
MNPDDLDAYETDLELSLYREYRDVVRMFRYVVETERRFYLCNNVEVTPHDGKDLYFELRMRDAWVWDMYRPARFIKDVRVLTFRDVNIEELAHDDHRTPRILDDRELSMGYDATNPEGEVIEWGISIWDTDYFWPIDGDKFAVNRVWYQNPWGNNNTHNVVRIHTRPDVDLDAELPPVGPEVIIPNGDTQR